MAAVESLMLDIGTTLPDRTLPDPVGNSFSLSGQKKEKGLLVMFICNHCPFVVHVAEELAKTSNEYMEKGIGFVAINVNDVENYPDDSPAKMKEFSQKYGFNFPYLFDESQQSAKDFLAMCTPEFYLFDAGLKLYYRGRLDDSTPRNGKELTGKDLREALDNLINGKPAPENQYPSIGCNIKWKKGNNPEYYTQ